MGSSLYQVVLVGGWAEQCPLFSLTALYVNLCWIFMIQTAELLLEQFQACLLCMSRKRFTLYTLTEALRWYHKMQREEKKMACILVNMHYTKNVCPFDPTGFPDNANEAGYCTDVF